MADSVLSIAVATGRTAYVYFEEGQLTDFALSQKASESPALAVRYVRQWISLLSPDVVVTESFTKKSRKGTKTRLLTEAMAREAARHRLNNIRTVRHQHYRNKYAEAGALAIRFPELNRVLPRRPRIWESEPDSISYFEAVALALPTIDHRAVDMAAK